MSYFNVNTTAGRAMFLAYELRESRRISFVECEAFVAALKDMADRESAEYAIIKEAQEASAHETKQ